MCSTKTGARSSPDTREDVGTVDVELTDYDELRRLAQAATPTPDWHGAEQREDNDAFFRAANPSTVLALLDEIEQLRDLADDEDREVRCGICGSSNHDGYEAKCPPTEAEDAALRARVEALTAERDEQRAIITQLRGNLHV
jgi:hypothetical protein